MSPGRAAFELAVGPYSGGELSVVSFRGREGLSKLYSFDILAVAAESRAGLLTELLGQTATLSLDVPGREPRRITGIAAEVTREGAHVVFGAAALRVRLVPRMWLLRRSKNSRIFQDRTVEQIVTAVLSDLRVPCAFRLRGAHRPKAYCVQYQETDFDFVRRIVAEEGIFFSFEPGAEGSGEPWDRAVFCDSAHYPSIGDFPGDSALPFRPEGGLAPGDEAVTSFAPARRVRAGSVLLEDFDFQRPLLDLTAEAVAGDDLPGHGLGPDMPRVYHPVSHYEDPEVQKERAEKLLAQLRRDARVARGKGSCARLAPGRRFDLEGHPDDASNRSHAVTRVEHEGRLPDRARGAAAEAGPVYQNTFECVPADVAHVPRRGRKAPLQVVETAIVVGPAGETVYTDKLGRIKVQFHWDRDGIRNEHSSCWIRVSQAWAGPSWGFQFIPRVGMEVLVSFVGGDPDRPVVMGCLYNPVNPPSHDLPASATKSGIRTRTVPGHDGYNELSFEDRLGQEMLFLHAERNLAEVAKNDHTITVGRFDPESPSGDQRVRVARDQETEIGGNQITKVSGTQEHAVLGDRRVTVEGGSISEVQGPRVDRAMSSCVQETASNHTLDVGGDGSFHVSGRAAHTTGGDREEEVSGTSKTRVGGYAALSVGGDYAVSAVMGVTLASPIGIRFVCGESSIDVGPREIVITAPTVTVGATRTAAVIAEGVSLHLEGKKAALSASERVELFAEGSELQLDEDGVKAAAKKDVKLFSQGASVVLDSDAKMDGATVKLNCGGASESPEEREPDELEVSWIEIELLRPVPRAGDPTQIEKKGVPGARYVAKAANGREYRGTLDGEGKARIAVPPGPVEVTFPDHDRGRIKPK